MERHSDKLELLIRISQDSYKGFTEELGKQAAKVIIIGIVGTVLLPVAGPAAPVIAGVVAEAVDMM